MELQGNIDFVQSEVDKKLMSSGQAQHKAAMRVFQLQQVGDFINFKMHPRGFWLIVCSTDSSCMLITETEQNR